MTDKHVWVLTAVLLAACGTSERDALRIRVAALRGETATATKERDDARADARSRTEALASAVARTDMLQSKVNALGRTASEAFDDVRAVEREALAAEDDETDENAAKALRAHARRYPEDASAAEALKRASALDARIRKRAADLVKAQARVRALIAECRANHRRSEQAHQESIRFTGMFQQLDLNRALAATHRIEALQEAATRAKDKATELLSEVEDPDGTLSDAIDGCDQDEER
ncbi:MAG: hypothetical protein RL199_438 [Pseudomonadota bacterium]|jgi:hypothetical protein